MSICVQTLPGEKTISRGACPWAKRSSSRAFLSPCANIRDVKQLAIAWALLRFYFRITPRNWYRHAPFLPLPPRDYLEWRFHTAYGSTRPPIGTVIRDIWQLGDWLRTFP